MSRGGAYWKVPQAMAEAFSRMASSIAQPITSSFNSVKTVVPAETRSAMGLRRVVGIQERKMPLVHMRQSGRSASGTML